MTATRYELELKRQRDRQDVPKHHLPVHRWYLRYDQPWLIESPNSPRDNLTVVRAVNPSVSFYRYLYHTAGEEFIWGDRRRKSDEELELLINHQDVHVMVLYDDGTPAGFFEVDFSNEGQSEIKYFALLPEFIGGGLGSYMLSCAILYAGRTKRPLILDTCSLDHPMALENYLKRGFEIYHQEDEIYLDPRLDGTIPKSAGKHVALAD